MNNKKLYTTTLILLTAAYFNACSKTPSTVKNINEYDVKKECSKEEINSCSQENKLYSIKENPELFLSINEPNKELQLQAVKNNPNVIKYIKKPSKEIQIEALKQDPTLIEFIHNPHKDALKY